MEPNPNQTPEPTPEPSQHARFLLPILLIAVLVVLFLVWNLYLSQNTSTPTQPTDPAPATITITGTIFGAADEQQTYLFDNHNLGLVATTAPKTLGYDQQMSTLRANLNVTDEPSLTLVQTAQRDPYALTLPNEDTLEDRLSGTDVRFTRAVITGAEPDLVNYLTTLNQFYDRERPVDIDSKLPRPDSNWEISHESAPSVTVAHVTYLTELLARLDADRAEEYRTLQANVKNAMQQTGVAFPRALNAGETIAGRYVEKLFTNQQFTTQYDKAEAEWSAN